MTYANVTIDAGILAVPPQDVIGDAAHNYVETILDWAKLLDEPWVGIYMSEQASTALFADGLIILKPSPVIKAKINK